MVMRIMAAHNNLDDDLQPHTLTFKCRNRESSSVHQDENNIEIEEKKTCPSPHSVRKKRFRGTKEICKKSRDSDGGNDKAKVSLVMGKVTLLRRGETLDSMKETKVYGGEGVVQESPAVDAEALFYGSAFFSSPSPSALPFPSFFTNKKPENRRDSVSPALEFR